MRYHMESLIQQYHQGFVTLDEIKRFDNPLYQKAAKAIRLGDVDDSVKRFFEVRACLAKVGGRSRHDPCAVSD